MAGNERKKNRPTESISMAEWIGIGAGAGVAFGAIYGDIGLGVALGAAVGAIIGGIEESRASKRKLPGNP